jgi:hypothetical protein
MMAIIAFVDLSSFRAAYQNGHLASPNEPRRVSLRYIAFRTDATRFQCPMASASIAALRAVACEQEFVQGH